MRLSPATGPRWWPKQTAGGGQAAAWGGGERPGAAGKHMGLGRAGDRQGAAGQDTSSFQIYTVERMNSRLQKRVFYVDETSFCKMDRLSAGHAKHTTFQKWCFTEAKPLLFIMLNLNGGAQCFERKGSDSRSLRTKNEG